MSSSSDDKKQPWYKKYKWYLVAGSVLLVCIIIGLVIFFKMKSKSHSGHTTMSDVPSPETDQSDLMAGTPAYDSPTAALTVP